MSDIENFPPEELPDSDFKPWEQRSAPGAGSGGGGGMARPQAEPSLPDQLCQEMQPNDLRDIVAQQTDLAYYPMVARYTTPDNDQQEIVHSNQEAWQLFLAEKLYDTRRVTLEHFHLFEWFPLAPGKFHTRAAQQQREFAREMMFTTPGGHNYFNPWGKASMIRGGIGNVRLRPRLVDGEPHYFMTVSSNATCHEGFPVLVPRRFYGPLKARLLQDGAVPVRLSGEMRYLYGDAPTFFKDSRDIPLLYLHADKVEVLPAPRPGIRQFSVSVAISFAGKFEEQDGIFATFATFNPAKAASLAHAVNWLEAFYVTKQYHGLVITDFDEIQPRFPGTVFGLPDLMAGKMDAQKVSDFLQAHGLSAQATRPFFLVYKEINTMGGDYIDGDKNISLNIGGDVNNSNIVIGDNNTLDSGKSG